MEKDKDAERSPCLENACILYGMTVCFQIWIIHQAVFSEIYLCRMQTTGFQYEYEK